MSEAVLYKEAINQIDYTPTAAKAAGEVVELADGRAGVVATDLAAAEMGAAYTMGVFTVAKTATMVVLDGQKLYWDAANSKCKYTGDFYIGVAVEDAASAATTVKVALNAKQSARIRMGESSFDYKEIDGGSDGVLGVNVLPGNEVQLGFDAIAEAALAMIISRDSIAVTADWIFEAWVNVVDKGDHTDLVLSVGVANASHDTDMESATEFCLLHLDGGTLGLDVASDDGTTDVAAEDTTANCVEGTPFFLQIDGRAPAAILAYVNGVVDAGTTAKRLDNATGPLKAIAHLAKASNDTTADVRVRDMLIRTTRTA